MQHVPDLQELRCCVYTMFTEKSGKLCGAHDGSHFVIGFTCIIVSGIFFWLFRVFNADLVYMVRRSQIPLVILLCSLI